MNGIKQYNKIFLLFFLALGLSSLIAPLIKIFLDSLLPSSPFLADLLKYKQESYDFGRVMRRIIMAVVLILILLLRKQLMIGSLIKRGIKPIRGWREQLQTGFLLGAGLFIFYITIIWINGIQNSMVAGLSEAEMADLGAFFAAQKADPHAPSDADLAAVGRYLYAKGNTFSGVAACAGCHGPAAHGTETLPRLAGQQSLYIEGQLRAFNRRERNNDHEVMHAIASKLTELEIKALSEFLAAAP